MSDQTNPQVQFALDTYIEAIEEYGHDLAVEYVREECELDDDDYYEFRSRVEA